jgi:hypothetical protein
MSEFPGMSPGFNLPWGAKDDPRAPWNDESEGEPCECGHPYEEHVGVGTACQHETPEEPFACSCQGFTPEGAY